MPKVSIKLKLVSSFVLIAAALFLAIYLVGLSWYSSEQVLRIDDFLESEANGVAAAVIAYYNQHFPGETTAPHYLIDAQFRSFIESFLARRADKPLPYKTTLSILDQLDRPMGSSNEALELDFDLLNETTARLYGQRALSLGEYLVSVNYKSLNYRVMYMPLTIDRVRIGALRIACLLDPTEHPINDFALTAFVFIVLAIASNVVGGLFLTTRVLKPVEYMRKSVEKITRDNLNTRIDILPGRDELSKLSSTLNDTLERIETAYRSQEELVQDLSHQLRTPLTSIRGVLDVALRKDRTIEELRNVIEDGIAEIDRMTSLLNTMLNFVQLDEHMVGVKFKKSNIIDLVAETVDELQPLWDEKSIRFRYSVEDKIGKSAPPVVSYHVSSIEKSVLDAFYANIDSFRLKQAFICILDNGFRYAPVQSEIVFSISADKVSKSKVISIRVTNSGPHIPGEIMSRLFEKFHHTGEDWERPLDSASGQKQSNEQRFGLGLSICKRIVELHHGSVRAFNVPTGGVTFEIKLPVVDSFE